MPNSPPSIPDAFAGEYLSGAYRSGWNHGHGIACHNVPTLGAKVRSESFGRVTVDEYNIREVHEEACHVAADYSRCYSPFEFLAAAMNNHGEGGWFILEDGERPNGPFDTLADAQAEANDADAEIVELPSSDEMWEAFEQGTGDAIAADLVDYDDENYGIEADDEYHTDIYGVTL